MTTTPPPMPETISSYYDEEEKRMYGMCSLMQVEARDAQWMERITALEAENSRLREALHRIDSIAVFLPTFDVLHEGGIEAVTENIVKAISKAVAALEKQP